MGVRFRYPILLDGESKTIIPFNRCVLMTYYVLGTVNMGLSTVFGKEQML